MNRIPQMDALRAFTMPLIVYYHSCFFYTKHCPDVWITYHYYKYAFFEIFNFIIHSFRLELLFFISGYFAIISCQNKGILGFFKNRFKRIFLPFIIFWSITFQWMIWLYAKGAFEIDSSSLELPLFHLWFLYYLIIFYGFFIFAMGLIKAMSIFPKLELLLNHFFDNFKNTFLITFQFLKFPWHILFLGLLTFPLLLLMHTTSVDTPVGFYPEVRLLIYYGLFFFLGCLFQKTPLLFDLLIQNRWLYLSLTLGCLIILLPQFIEMDYRAPILDRKLLLYRVLYAINSWSLVFTTLAFFLKIFKTVNYSLQYLSRASYWIYLIHFPFVLYLQSYFNDKMISEPLKPILIFVIATLTLLIIYQFGIRKTKIGLNLGLT